MNARELEQLIKLHDLGLRPPASPKRSKEGSRKVNARARAIARAGSYGATIPRQWTAAERRRAATMPAMPVLAEVRYRPLGGVEVRTADDTDELVITGSPIVYDTPYTVVDKFGKFEERIMPGAARDALAKGADVRLLFNHDGLPLARTKAGTLTINDGPTNMTIRATLDARQQLANDLAIAVQRGDVNQMSIGFVVAPGGDTWNEPRNKRTITRFAEFLDVSAVTYPCSPTTSIKTATRGRR